jgi:hypothetical protein
MSERKIPAELEPAVAELVKQKKSTRFISEWLHTEHGLDASHMSVHRFVERQRLIAFGVPDIDAELAEAQGEVGAHLRTLSALSEQFGELGERAMQGEPQAGKKPNLTLASKLFAKQARLIIDWLRCLDRHANRRELAVKAARDARAKINSDLKHYGSARQKADAEQREWQQLLDEATRRERAVGWQPVAAAV